MSYSDDVPLDRSAATSTPDDWKNTVLAGLANYIDGGSIVAGAAGLALWATAYGFSSSFVGVLAAVSSNAISAGVGALVGGRLCDKWGRKRIYQWDMLLYAFGVAWIVFAAQPWMLVLGYVLAGLAVGADVPASWTLIAESAPDQHRGKHSGVAQILWYLGPAVVLLMTLALSSLGLLGIRIVFAHLLVLTRTVGDATGHGRVLEVAGGPGACGGRVAKRVGGHRGGPLAAAADPAEPERDALLGRHVRHLEPVCRDQRVLLAVHLENRRHAEPGDERRAAVRDLHTLDACHRLRVHEVRGQSQPASPVRCRRRVTSDWCRTVRSVPPHLARHARVRAPDRDRSGDWAAVVLPAMERRVVPHAAAQHRSGAHLRGCTHRTGDLELLRASPHGGIGTSDGRVDPHRLRACQRHHRLDLGTFPCRTVPRGDRAPTP